MSERNKYFVGRRKDTGQYEVFASKVEPTETTHGNTYSHAIGPFYRKKDAIHYVENTAYLSPIPVYAPSYRADS